MAIEITPEDIKELNDRIIVARYFTHTDGTEDVWVKGSLNDILDYFVPEGSMIANFSIPALTD